MGVCDIAAVYADGGVIGANPSPIGGTWAWCFVNADNQRIHTASGVVLPRTSCPLITNNLTEFLAVVKALEALPEGWSGTVYSDSQVTIGRIFWGWKQNNLPLVLLRQANAAIARLDFQRCTAVLLDGHPTRAQLLAGRGKRGNLVSEHNVWCDLACQREARAYREVA